MPLSRKEYNEMIAYITKPRTKTISEDKKSYSEEMRIGTDEMIDEEQYKNFIPVMPDMPGMEDPKLRQVELAEGGLPRVSKNALADDALKGLQTMKKKGIKNVSKYASQIAKSPLSKFIAAETGLGALVGAPLDYASGYSGKEILLNLPTFGLGTTIKDEIDMLSSVNKKDRDLLLQYAAKSGTRHRDRLRGIETIIDKDTQKALDARDAFFEKLEAKREKVAESRKDKTPTSGFESYEYVPE
jgi:hypothetical protein